jgi:putative copper export protein
MLLGHILGATIWTGGHLVLSIGYLPGALRTGRIEPLRDFEHRFEKIGIPALILQVATGLWLAYRYLPSLDLWFSFQSSLQANVTGKLILLGLTLLLALHARLRLVPRMESGQVGWLAVHILCITVTSVGFVLLGVGIRTGWN